MEQLCSSLARIVGASNVVADPAEMLPYLTEWRGLFAGRANAVIVPKTVDEVAAVVGLARRLQIPIVPQGGNTGLVGGQIPTDDNCLLLSLKRLNRVRDIDAFGNTMVVESGVTLAQAQAAAAAVDRLFPLSLASEGSCTIGGNIATNAGGVATLAFGNMRDLTLGLEVVLADGRVWRGLSRLRKDNTGLDLRHLFIGSEGVLGVVTAASLKLFPRPKSVAAAFCGLKSPEDAIRLLTLAREQVGPELTAFELIPRLGVDLVRRHIPQAQEPLPAASDWYALLEVSSQRADAADATLLGLLEFALDRCVIGGAAIAQSSAQQKAFWRFRESMSEAQKHEGGSIKHDISVPVAAVADFIRDASEAVLALDPDARPLAFGHVGDGNIHFNISQPIGADKKAFVARWDEFNEVVHAIVARYGGSISAEHGIGRLKRDLLPRFKDQVALDAMRAIKLALDPDGMFNPGAVL